MVFPDIINFSAFQHFLYDSLSVRQESDPLLFSTLRYLGCRFRVDAFVGYPHLVLLYQLLQIAFDPFLVPMAILLAC